MKVPQVLPVFNKEMEEAAIHALRNERFLLHESVAKFEEEFAKYIGMDYGISTANGTDALIIAFNCLELENKTGITTPTTFVATSNAMIHAKMTPKFVDVDVRGNMDPSKLFKADIVVPVHLYGHPADMDQIMDFASKNSMPVLEDACQAHGAEYHGKKAGSIGDVSVFSFYQTKTMTVCGDGGMILTNDEKIAEKAISLRHCGRTSNPGEHGHIGYSSRLHSANAAIGRVQLRYLDKWLDRRKEVASEYEKVLPEEVLIPNSENIKHSYYQFAIRVKERDKFMNFLKQNEIGCGMHYPIPIHLQPPYRKMGFKQGDFPEAERFAQEVVSLPMFNEISGEQVSYVCEKLKEYFEGD